MMQYQDMLSKKGLKALPTILRAGAASIFAYGENRNAKPMLLGVTQNEILKQLSYM